MDIKEKFQDILKNSTFAGSSERKPFKNLTIQQKRKRLKSIQKKLNSNRVTRNVPYVHGILDEIVAGMDPVCE